MHIHQVITRSELGGTQSIVLSLLESFCEADHTATLASGPGGGGEACKSTDSLVYYIVESLLNWLVSPFKDFLAIREMSRIYREWKPDIVHTHPSKAAAIGRLASGIDHRRIVYTMHGCDQPRDVNRKLLLVD